MGESDFDTDADSEEDAAKDADTCSRCGDPLDPERDHHVALSRTSVDLRTARRSTDERVFCLDCTASYLDADPDRAAGSGPVGE
ncbi:hypothetical protein [Halorussus salinus]|uniref:hypothetical protein n=1 Tax=Halorussus salinus TaxID=1364935 RepID=UPI001091D7F4|nr:hypothetical protein [Halorussus salinus]